MLTIEVLQALRLKNRIEIKMGDEFVKKQRTADVLDCILGKKDPSVLKKKKKPVVSIDDSDGGRFQNILK